MDRVYLATADNGSYLNELQARGIRAVPLEPDGFPSALAAPGSGRSLLITELAGGGMAIIKELAKRCGQDLPSILCLSREIDETMRSELLGLGISDLLPPGDASRVGKYVTTVFAEAVAPARDTLLALETEGPYSRVLGSIAARFSYSIALTGTIDGLFSALDDISPELVLVNLGTAGFDISEFMMKSNTSTRIRSYPLVAYKDMRHGFFIHEIATGIGRLTRTILSCEELLGYLTDLLLRNELNRLAGSLVPLIKHGEFDREDISSLRRLFYATGQELSGTAGLYSSQRYAEALELSDLLHHALVKADGLRWLMIDAGKGPTCGAGA